MDVKMLQEHLEFYRRELEENILPFWLQRSLDFDFGGYFTCFNNRGTDLVATDKYVWSQGRLVWVFSELASMYPDKEYLSYAKLGADFLMQKAVLDNGHCAFLLSREGDPKEVVEGGGHDSSIYADCFVVLGLARYGAVTKKRGVLDFAWQLYQSIRHRLETHFRTEPYPVPPGYKAHGIPMIMLNTSQGLRDCLQAFDDGRYLQINEHCNVYVQDILSTFYKEDGLIHEMVNLTEAGDSLLTRYINPGHTLEDMWFVMQQAVLEDDQTLIDTCAKIMERTYEIGWDQEYGGLLLFVDKDGGPPRGATEPLAEHPMVKKVQADWSHKLWWTHAEALYATLLGYQLTKRPQLLELYSRIKDYTFKTFPNPDTRIGEWIQIRDRQGAPIDTVVALPVKDPYHIARNLVLLIQLIEQMLAAWAARSDLKGSC